jgi:hypothetical protein
MWTPKPPPCPLQAATWVDSKFKWPSRPSTPVTYPIGHYDERVDYSEFKIGQYMIRFGEVYREA